MRSLTTWIAAAALAAAASPFAAPLASAKAALVIGNGSYDELADLDRPVADASAYAAVLADKGYDVVEAYDADLREMTLALARFLALVEPGDKAIFVFAGHGWSDGLENFLLPIDAPQRADAVTIRGLSMPLKNGVNGVLDQVALSGAGLQVAIVDACRDNPFSPDLTTRSIAATRGLAPIAAARGSFVVFSAASGETALDALGADDPHPNSVFTRAFLPLLEQDLSLEDAMNDVSLLVPDLAFAVGHQQNPAYYDEAPGPTCLVEDCARPAPPAPPVADAPSGPVAPTISPDDVARPTLETLGPEEALAALTALAEEGDIDAMRDLGLLLSDPTLAAHDPEAAFAWFERAAAAGDAEALFRLGRAHQGGDGAPVNAARAATAYQRAADAGHIDAMNNLAVLLVLGAEGVAPDAPRGLALLEQAADLGDGRAAYNLAAILDDGVHAAYDAERAASAMLKALMNGEDAARDAMLSGSNAWSRGFRAELQSALSAAGFDAGPADGAFGPRTRGAVEAAFGTAASPADPPDHEL